jgi:hypothetical protein
MACAQESTIFLFKNKIRIQIFIRFFKTEFIEKKIHRDDTFFTDDERGRELVAIRRYAYLGHFLIRVQESDYAALVHTRVHQMPGRCYFNRLLVIEQIADQLNWINTDALRHFKIL